MDSKKMLKELGKLQKSLWEVNLTEFATMAPSIVSAKSVLSELEGLLRKAQATEKRQQFGQKVSKASEVTSSSGKKSAFADRMKGNKKSKTSRHDKVTEAAADEDCAVAEILQKISGLKPRTLPWAAKLLGIAVTSDAEQAKLAFRNRAKLVHPDSSAHALAQEVFQSLQWALEDFLRFEAAR